MKKKFALEIRQVKVPQQALPPIGPRLRLKSPNCRYTEQGLRKSSQVAPFFSLRYTFPTHNLGSFLNAQKFSI